MRSASLLFRFTQLTRTKKRVCLSHLCGLQSVSIPFLATGLLGESVHMVATLDLSGPLPLVITRLLSIYFATWLSQLGPSPFRSGAI
ncbi:hypothetical protein DL89DRAFT_87694 [Linderina pennispora]|uniref:Uncharacterized protein n=1 Tax=Linderina pennispora TaxID=61395 RepID=A0A1Y1WI83_9FUNG|nr:uncharacterized protein DL89DRAFT_87694 [Linderina pennispora]ORX73075.1 hypothetical protein DL89DRAFT_87694 [Linderina pennispora]